MHQQQEERDVTFFRTTLLRQSETMSAEQIVPYSLSLERRHRPMWSRRKARLVRHCGGGLPCRSRHRSTGSVRHHDHARTGSADLDLRRVRRPLALPHTTSRAPSRVRARSHFPRPVYGLLHGCCEPGHGLGSRWTPPSPVPGVAAVTAPRSGDLLYVTRAAIAVPDSDRLSGPSGSSAARPAMGGSGFDEYQINATGEATARRDPPR